MQQGVDRYGQVVFPAGVAGCEPQVAAGLAHDGVAVARQALGKGLSADVPRQPHERMISWLAWWRRMRGGQAS